MNKIELPYGRLNRRDKSVKHYFKIITNYLIRLFAKLLWKPSEHREAQKWIEQHRKAKEEEYKRTLSGTAIVIEIKPEVQKRPWYKRIKPDREA